MQTRLQITNLGKSFNNLLFEEVVLTATAPCKIGFIGDNGSGKSTLLKMMINQESVDDGTVAWTKGAKVGYLPQEIVTDNELSGGEKKIKQLQELFYSDYAVLLLDEPDNHLDLDHKIWFEQLVAEYEGILIVISHDRNFLTNSIDKVWLLEEKTIREYSFGFEKFSEIYVGEMAARKHQWKDQEKERLRLADMVERFRSRAASSKKMAKTYHSAVLRYNKFVAEMVKKPPEDPTIKLGSDLDKQHQRKTALHLKELHKSYGEKQVLKGINLHLFCGEKVAINAPNGAGKSTLLNIISGKLTQSSGEMTIGPNLKLGCYSQEHLEALDESKSIIENLQKSMTVPFYQVASYLKRFLFDNNQVRLPVRLLSGGQKSRVQLAKFLATNPDILILDEPTNHLDLKTVFALENFLKDYQGALVLVSHDRQLVDNVVDTVYELENGQLIRK